MTLSKRFELGDSYWLGDFYENTGWRRLTLFHIARNSFGGSTSLPVAEIDIVDHPSKDGCNAHTEIKISIRNDVGRINGGIDVDQNKIQLQHPSDVLENDVIRLALAKLKEHGIASDPLCVYVCMRHEEDFWVEGDFWNHEV